MDHSRELTPMKRSTTAKTIENASPLRVSRSASVTESRLNLQFWGQSFLAENRGKPVSMIDFENERIFEIYSGETHMFINTKSKNIYGYGDNKFKQIDSSAPKECNASAPIEITQRISVTKIFCGCDFTYLIGAKTKLFSWGSNFKGQLGLGHTENVSDPAPVRNFVQSKSDSAPHDLPEGEYPTDVMCGALHAIVKTNKERLFSTGFGETYALGHGNSQNLTTLKEISFFTDLANEKGVSIGKVEVGVTHSACLVAKRLFVWGMYGSDKTQLAKKPTIVQMNGDVAEFFCGDMLTVVLTEAGEVMAFGDNSDDQLTSESNNVVKIPIPGKIEYIAGGLNHTFAVNFSKGKIFAWGSNRFGQIMPTSQQQTYKTPTEMTWLYQNGSFALTCKGNNTFFVSKSKIKLEKEQTIDSARDKLRESPPAPLQVSTTPEYKLLANELETKNRILEGINRENQQLKEEVSRLSGMLTSSTKISNTSTSDPSDTNVEINDCDLTSDCPIQTPTQKGKDPQTLLRNRLQGNRNHQAHRRGGVRGDLQGQVARNHRGRQNPEAGAYERGNDQGLPVWAKQTSAARWSPCATRTSSCSWAHPPSSPISRSFWSTVTTGPSGAFCKTRESFYLGKTDAVLLTKSPWV